MARLEPLEARRLLATLVPDLQWGDDGFLARRNSQGLIGVTPSGIFVSDTLFDGPDYRGDIRRYDLHGDLATNYGRVSKNASLKPAADGRLYIATTKTGVVTLQRVNPDGTDDRSFGDGGSVTISLDDKTVNDTTVQAITLTPDGAVYVGLNYVRELYDKNGAFRARRPVAAVYKLDRRRRVDASFAGRGRMEYVAGGTLDFVWSAVTNDGRVTFASGQSD